MKTFDELCLQFTVTPAERVELIWFLAQYRYRATVEGLSLHGHQA